MRKVGLADNYQAERAVGEVLWRLFVVYTRNPVGVGVGDISGFR